MSRRHQTVDPRDLPAYSAAEAARYLGLPPSTVRWWAVGRGSYKPLIEPAEVRGSSVFLSFLNLVELHVLGVIRREHEVTMYKVRSAIDFLKKQLSIERHPLINQAMLTDGADLFIEHLGKLVNISRHGQEEMREVLLAALRRIEWDTKGLPIKFYPFTRSNLRQAPTTIEVDSRLAGGRPVIAGTGLAIDVIVERYRAGESMDELVRDYGRPSEEIQEAIRCELRAAA